MTNLADVLLAPAQRTPDAIALRAGPDSMTYRELESRAARVAGALRAEGVQPGDRVTIEGHNTIAFVTSYLGALRVGAVAVPLNPQAPDPELDRELATVEPAVMLGPPAAKLVEATAQRVSGRCHDPGSQRGGPCTHHR